MAAPQSAADLHLRADRLVNSFKKHYKQILLLAQMTQQDSAKADAALQPKMAARAELIAEESIAATAGLTTAANSMAELIAELKLMVALQDSAE